MSRSDTVDVDIAVAVAGLAGLSFVVWLERLHARTGEPIPSVRLIDPRPDYRHDRNWCFWEGVDHPFSAGITHRWPRWEVAHAGTTVSATAPGHPYAVLPAENLYRIATHCIDSHAEFTLELGRRVEHVESADDAVIVRTDRDTIRARGLIDTRPPCITEATARSGLWQVFHGAEITVGHDRFDPTKATLMDFASDHDDIRFCYILPTSARRALVEITAFRRDPCAADIPAHLDTWIDDHLGDHATRVREEQGRLPMMPLPEPECGDPRIITAGTAAGWMRPASGYLFSACQRGARDLAQQALCAKASSTWHWRRPRVRAADLDLLDRIFLHALRGAPADAPTWFLRLFERTGGERQARFLSDVPTLGDRLAIIAALPPGPMLHAARQCLRPARAAP
ncbi:MAG: lycopene cyclase family protein [Halofilum sp. (in: g-proteobacteria)]